VCLSADTPEEIRRPFARLLVFRDRKRTLLRRLTVERNSLIFGAHLLVYSEDAAADRAFFRDVFEWDAVDAGNGWLIFALPPGEAAVHPADHASTELFLMSSDLPADMRILESRGVKLSHVEEAAWGSVTRLRLPGGAQVGLYQPNHPSPISPSRAAQV
jgi:hypothetical protein